MDTKDINSFNLNSEEDSDLSFELSLEDKLLIQLSRFILESDVLKTVKEMKYDEIDWNVFLDGARRHKLSGLIHHHCITNNICLPPEVMIELTEYAVYNRERAKFLYSEIDIVSEALADEDFPVIVLKGPVLSRQIYGSLSSRPFGDIDLLVSSDCISQIEKRLHEIGYVYVKQDYENDRYIPLNPSEVNQPRPLSLHQPILMRINDTEVYDGPTIDLHVSNLKLGRVDFESIINKSSVHPAFGPGLQVPLPEDLVIYSAYHFYRHYRLALVTDVWFSRTSLPRQTGALKFLADINACLYFYLRSYGDWWALIRRSVNIFAMEILFYALYYLRLVYGKDTVPKQVLDDLAENGEFEIPIHAASSVPVSCVQELLKPQIRTTAVDIGPFTRLLHPQNLRRKIIDALNAYKSKKEANPIANCLRIEKTLVIDGLPSEKAWECAEKLSIDQDNVNPRQFFLTHVTGGIWPSLGGVRAYLRFLWDSSNLYIRIDVSADAMHFVNPEFIENGEVVMLYFSDVRDETVPIKRIGVAIGESGYFSSPPSSVSKSCHDIELGRTQISVSTSRNGFRLGFGIPWNVLEKAPVPDTRFGFDVEVIHRCSTMALKTALAWSGGQFLSEVHPAVHGTLTLVNR